MIEAGHLYNGASVIRKYKLGATMADPGIVLMASATTVGLIPCTTTSMADAAGLALDEGSYTTTQATVASSGEGLVTVSKRPDLIIEALASGGSTEGTALTTLSNTAASAGGTVITDADTGAADMDGGTVWCTKGANKNQSRSITTHTGSTSFTVTVPFPYAIAVGDEFLFVPWNPVGTGAAGADGIMALQTTTLFTQADASIACGTGGEVCIESLELNGSGDTKVRFTLRLHVAASATIAS